MITPTEGIVAEIALLTDVIATAESGLVETKLARGRLWGELDDDAMADILAEMNIGLACARQERWCARKLDAAPRDWLNWTATRALAGLSEDVREDVLANAARAGTETSEAVGRLIRAYHQSRRAEANGEHPAGPDPVTVADQGAYILARLDGELGADFDGATIARVHRVVLAALAEWERAHGDA